MYSRSRPSAANFLTFALEAFSKLPLETKTEEKPTWYAITFKSHHIEFCVYFDIRDAFVGCVINKLRTLECKSNIDLPPYCPLENYLYENVDYRGSLSEFKPKNIKLTYWKMDLLTYSNAIRHFFSEEIGAHA